MNTQHWMRTLVLAAMAALVPGGLAWAQSANTLEEVTSTQLPGDKVQVTLRLSGPASDPASFSIDNPARIALDLPNTTLKLAAKTVPVNIGQVRSVTAAESKGRTRVVVNLAQSASFETRTEGNLVQVLIASSGDAVPAVQGAAATGAPAASPAGGKEIANVEFRRGAKGQAIINVQLPSKKAVVDMRQEGGKIVLDMQGIRLPSRLERTLDVMDFATPVQTVNARNKAGGAVIEVAMAGTPAIEHMAYQSNESYTLEVRPLTKTEQEQQAKKAEYTGEKLSLNFQDIEVRAVLQLLADFTGFNMVVSDNVTGNLTLRLKNVPWDQAMDIILKTKGLDKRQNGNVVYIAPAADIAAQEKLALEASRQITELAPLSSEFIQVNYAKAAELATLLKAKENKLLSERGNVTVDPRTNTLLIQDSSDRLADVRKLMSVLDRPVRQVLIESRIVRANDDFTKNLGVRFGYGGEKVFNSNKSFAVVNGTLDTGTLSLPEPHLVGNTGFTGETGTLSTIAGIPGASGNHTLIVDLPAAGATSGIGLAVGKLGSYFLQLELQAAQVEGRGEVISSPRLITADQKESTIETGVEIPYQEASSSGATSVSFKKAVLSLKVKPQITPDERVIMDLAVNKDSVGTLYSGVPSINTQTVTTQVLVNNGETVVLGGVYERTNTNSVSRTPFFGELPYVGWAFRNEAKIDQKSELLVFITPKILRENAGLN
jgi:type IV pilus assembly protein PilQ